MSSCDLTVKLTLRLAMKMSSDISKLVFVWANVIPGRVNVASNGGLT